jgi:putative membrane protein
LTTASTAGHPAFRDNRFLHWTSALAALAIAISAYHPERVFDFFLENATASVFMITLALTYRRLPLSDLSYALLLGYLCLHEWGAHYKYSDVPLGEWMKPWLGTQRNNYDRVVHFAFGFLLCYPFQEMFTRAVGVRSWWRYLLPVETILALSAIYEMLEAFMASILTPERGEEFVGMQGDMWDSQKDMFDAGLGCVVGLVLIAVARAMAVRAKLRVRQAAEAELERSRELVAETVPAEGDES